MKTDNLIHKVHITSEARFDYEDMFGSIEGMPVSDMRWQVEEYFDILKAEGFRIDWCQRIKYFDEDANAMLLLFIKESRRFGNMQVWDVLGIMLADDFDEELECEGAYRVWHNTKIEDLPDEDWVVDFYERLAEQERLRKLDEAEETRKNELWK